MLYWLFIIIFSTGPAAAWLKMCILWQSIREKKTSPTNMPPPRSRVNSQVHPALCWQLLTCPRTSPSSQLLSASVWFDVFFIHPSRREKFLQSWQEVIKGNLIQPFHWSLIVPHRTIKLHIRCGTNMIRNCFQFQKEDKGERERERFNQ